MPDASSSSDPCGWTRTQRQAGRKIRGCEVGWPQLLAQRGRGRELLHGDDLVTHEEVQVRLQRLEPELTHFDAGFECHERQPDLMADNVDVPTLVVEAVSAKDQVYEITDDLVDRCLRTEICHDFCRPEGFADELRLGVALLDAPLDPTTLVQHTQRQTLRVDASVPPNLASMSHIELCDHRAVQVAREVQGGSELRSEPCAEQAVVPTDSVAECNTFFREGSVLVVSFLHRCRVPFGDGTGRCFGRNENFICGQDRHIKPRYAVETVCQTQRGLEQLLPRQ